MIDHKNSQRNDNAAHSIYHKGGITTAETIIMAKIEPSGGFLDPEDRFTVGDKIDKIFCTEFPDLS